MHFEVIPFLQNSGIEYSEFGKNVAKGHVNIKCPFCADDPSMHMGIQIDEPHYWGCWRDTSHRGKKLQRLIMTLTRCSYDEACKILGVKRGALDSSTWAAITADPDAMWDTEAEAEEEEKEALQLNEEFRYLNAWYGSMSAKHPLDYLISRGFKQKDLYRLVRAYNLHYACTGDYKNRIIFPVEMGGKLVTWTSRSIYAGANIRYKSLDAETATFSIYDCLYGFDVLLRQGGEYLFVTEGPMDRVKLDYYAKPFGSRATCLFSKTISDIQKFYLLELSESFSKVLIVLDPEELGDSIAMEREMSFLSNVEMVTLDSAIEDPGAMTPKQIEDLCHYDSL